MQQFCLLSLLLSAARGSVEGQEGGAITVYALTEVVFLCSEHILLALVCLEGRGDVELARFPLLPLLDVAHGCCEGGGPGPWGL